MSDSHDGQSSAPISRRDLLKAAAVAGVATSTFAQLLQPALAASTRSLPQRRACTRIAGTRYSLGGWIGNYLKAVSEQWLKVAPFSNPAMLEMFRDRDREPKRELVPWAGYFAWKYLVSAIQVYRVTGDPSLKKVISDVVTQMISLQAEDGYVGPWPKENRLTQEAPNVRMNLVACKGFEEGCEKHNRSRKTWDPLGHYHAMLGLLLWYEETGGASALTSARKIGDLLCNVFEHKPLLDMEAAPAEAIHILDYKPNARREKPIAQLMVYALALSRRTGFRLFDFVCAWFDEHDYFEFYPLRVVHKRARRGIAATPVVSVTPTAA